MKFGNPHVKLSRARISSRWQHPEQTKGISLIAGTLFGRIECKQPLIRFTMRRWAGDIIKFGGLKSARAANHLPVATFPAHPRNVSVTR
jgi:hypothetical protein